MSAAAETEASAVDAFGTFLAAVRFEEIAGEAIETAKLRLLDLLAAALNGVRVGTWRPILELAGDGAQATIWGTGRQSTLRDAALLNGFLAHASYVEDGSRFTGGHPSSATVPAALTLAEHRHASGRELLAAMLAGYEVFLRLGRALYPAIVERGFQSTAVLAPLSSAAACSVLLGLDVVASAHALAIAANAAGGLKEALKDPASQPLQVGRGAEAGLSAALLARAGVTGTKGILENGFFKAFAGGAQTEAMLEGLGRDFAIGETYVKIHGGCRGIHAPADALRELLAREALRAEDLRRLSIFIDPVTRAADIDEPENAEQAQFSVRFAAAAQLVFGDVSTFRFTDAALADRRLQDLIGLVTVRADPALEAGYPQKRSARILAETRDGRRFEHFLDNARGEPESPFGRREVEEKFMSFAAPLLGEEGADRVVRMVAAAEGMPDVSALVRALRVPDEGR